VHQLQSDLPKILVLDSSMLHLNNLNQIQSILALKKTIPIMVLYHEEDDLNLYHLVDIGFSVIVSRNVSKEEWLKALQMAQMDKIYFCTTIAQKVFDLEHQMDKIKQIERMQALNVYDKYILVRICQEASSKQIAYEVGHSKRTVEGHRTKLMQKFDVKNVAGLVKVAFMTKLYDHYLSNPGLYEVTLCAKTSSL
jgi:DNA-binding NarL/FixJ family response regulator